MRRGTNVKTTKDLIKQAVEDLEAIHVIIRAARKPRAVLDIHELERKVLAVMDLLERGY
jgi:hypothetical protein